MTVQDLGETSWESQRSWDQLPRSERLVQTPCSQKIPKVRWEKDQTEADASTEGRFVLVAFLPSGVDSVAQHDVISIE